MSDEPRRIATPGEPWGHDRFFCLHCGTSFYSDGGAKSHVRVAHKNGEESGEKGEDYAQGWQVELMLDRHAQWVRRQQLRAERYFESIVTVEDFLLECENDR